MIDRIEAAAREGDLAGVMAQVRRALDEDDRVWRLRSDRDDDGRAPASQRAAGDGDATAGRPAG
ncbi:MAG: hypothetical protein WCE44_11810 [Candidatus Velthaea sp.]